MNEIVESLRNLPAEFIEIAARAIQQIREQNGGPPYDALNAIYGERAADKAREQLFEEVGAVIGSLSAFLSQKASTD